MIKNIGVSACLALFCVSAHAGNERSAHYHQWDISLLGSYLSPDADRRFVGTGQEIESEWGASGALGYRFSERLGMRFIASHWDLEANADAFGIDALFHINDDLLYWIAGYKHHDFDGQDDDAINLGLGKRFALTDNLFLTAEALAIRSVIDSYTDMSGNLGLTYAWGGTGKRLQATPPPDVAPVVQAPIDSDKDGVYDSNDRCPDTPASDAVDSQGCSRFEMIDESVALKVNFANNSARVKESYFNEIKRVADFMRKYPKTRVVIQGHTSSQGDAGYNQRLSEQRASNVADILIQRYRISPSRVSHIGYGEQQLLNPGNTRQAHAENRRIVAKLSATHKVRVKR